MFEKITPEEAGISSKQVEKYIRSLEKRGAATHGLLMMRGGKIFAEYYWKPFHQEFCHRMYSQTKSFVGVAIGLLEEEGKLNLDDKIVKYFPEKIDGELPEYRKAQTIREMLTMSTAGGCKWWFSAGDPDRTHLYLSEMEAVTRPAGTIWEYDSAGSQVLSALVEKLTGKKLLDYLKEKLFNTMGTFQTAHILETPNGDSWGDSAMLCTLRDMASFGHLVMHYGEWEGKRLMNEAYLREATSAVRNNKDNGYYNVFRHGYGYQIWRTENNGFAFVGMGDQITLCFPDKDLLMAITSDNQGNPFVRQRIVANFVDFILEEMQDESLPEDKKSQQRLAEIGDKLELLAMKGAEDSPFRAELNGATYICEKNPMGITKFTFYFDEDGKTGKLCYTNAQGDKELPFGVNHNVFGKFPQLGYANDRGAVPTTDGYMHKDAVSFAWLEDKKLIVYAQIIDRYFGNMSAVFAFKGEEVCASFTKTAEHFLAEYVGQLVAKKQ